MLAMGSSSFSVSPCSCQARDADACRTAILFHGRQGVTSRTRRKYLGIGCQRRVELDNPTSFFLLGGATPRIWSIAACHKPNCDVGGWSSRLQLALSAVIADTNEGKDFTLCEAAESSQVSPVVYAQQRALGVKGPFWSTAFGVDAWLSPSLAIPC